jgi:hypothetical protein
MLQSPRMLAVEVHMLYCAARVPNDYDDHPNDEHPRRPLSLIVLPNPK